MSAKVVPLLSELPKRIYDRYAFPPSKQDDEILLARLRLTASNIDLDLRMREALIPTATSMTYPRVDAIFRSDLELCIAWLNDRRPTLEELHLITRILDKWSKNHSRTNPYWSDQPTPDEAELNQRILCICERLKRKGQYTVEEDINGHR
jgi:hypothetical protein